MRTIDSLRPAHRSADAHIRDTLFQLRELADVGIRAPISSPFIDPLRARKTMAAVSEPLHGEPTPNPSKEGNRKPRPRWKFPSLYMFRAVAADVSSAVAPRRLARRDFAFNFSGARNISAFVPGGETRALYVRRDARRYVRRRIPVHFPPPYVGRYGGRFILSALQTNL